MATRGGLTEQGFIDHIAALSRPSGAARGGVVLGIGDDAAVLPATGRLRLLATTDLLAEDVHFTVRGVPPFYLGRKALAVNLSDIAAMGGVPTAFVLSAGFPRKTTAAWAYEMARGVASQARRFGVVLAGGDTTAARALFLNVALFGLVEKDGEVRRSGARVGDGVYVTGRLGASEAGRTLLGSGERWSHARGSRRTVLRAHIDPEPRVVAGRVLGRSGIAAAMIDLSDGLAQDLPRLCAASGAGAVVEEAAVPVAPAAAAVLGPSRARRAALVGGEDYELLFTARPDHEPLLRRLSVRLRTPVARIGQIVPKRRGVRLLTRSGRYLPFEALRGGFRHFPHDA